LWVTSSRHAIHEENPLPLALGRPTCNWRQAGTERLEAAGRAYRVLYSSWNSTAVGAVVIAGLAVSILPESAIRPGMRVLGPSDGFPPLPSCKIGLLRNWRERTALADALAGMIVQSLDNLASHAEAAE
jgi:DNA-binding transcriptional LysR family regulator